TKMQLQDGILGTQLTHATEILNVVYSLHHNNKLIIAIQDTTITSISKQNIYMLTFHNINKKELAAHSCLYN
ncbi:hypothetical protein ACJX0J_026575, partial [Zea mays]